MVLYIHRVGEGGREGNRSRLGGRFGDFVHAQGARRSRG